MRLPAPALIGLILLALTVLIGLGVWQLERNEWKQQLVAESHARTDAPALTVADSDNATPEDIDYRRVLIEGDWLIDDALFLANRARSSVLGEEVIIPVQPPTGPAILVNMGWYPTAAREDVLRGLRDENNATVEGLALDGSDRDGFRAPGGGWSGIAPRVMGSALGYEVAEWFVLAGGERTSPPSPGESVPVQGWQRVHNTTPHMEYALTWFGIAAALVVIAVMRLVVQPRRAGRDP